MIKQMSREHMHAFFKQFQYDPMAENTPDPKPYIYNVDAVNRYYDQHVNQGKIHFAVFLDDAIVGDVYLKHFNSADKSCELGIYLVNDNYKGSGYGTQAEQLVLDHTFRNMDIDVIRADTLIKNERSRRALEKAGFIIVRTDAERIYMECRKQRQDGIRDTNSDESA